MKPLSIAVVGGSLGGLTTACLLRDAGHDVTVFERSSKQLEERGAGIGFLRATARYLVDRGGLDIGQISVETPNIRYLDRAGDVIHEQDQPYLFSSWNTVYRELMKLFDADRYRLNHELASFVQDADSVRLTFVDGSTFDCDLLVAADGIGSVTRQALQPAVAPKYAGYVAWRGMVPESELEPEISSRLVDAITYYVYANSHILVYPIPDATGSVEAGDRLINFVWYRNYLEGSDLESLLTDNTGTRRELSVPPGLMDPAHSVEARATAAARLPPVLAQMVERVDDLFVQTIYDIEVESMVFDRVCLLGDAAFAVRPHAAAGTAKAAEDGWALAAALSGDAPLEVALAGWEQTQLLLGRSLLQRTRDVGSQSQISNTWTPGDADLIFGLHEPGDGDPGER